MPRFTPPPVVLLLTGASLLGWFAPPAQALADDEAREGYISLFNGKDFTGWRFGETIPTAATLPPNWKVEDGVIKLSGGNSPHLASQGEYGDFDVRFQWRAMREKYNSGFFIRSGREVKANQINLSQSAVGKLMSGAQGGDAVPRLQKPVGEWNDWRRPGDRRSRHVLVQRPESLGSDRLQRPSRLSRSPGGGGSHGVPQYPDQGLATAGTAEKK